MYWDIVEAKIVEPWIIYIRFADGLQGHVRFDSTFFEGVFSPLRDTAQFAQVSLSFGALTWPGGLDLAPDALYKQLSKTGECLLTGTSASVTA